MHSTHNVDITGQGRTEEGVPGAHVFVEGAYFRRELLAVHLHLLDVDAAPRRRLPRLETAADRV